MPQDVKPVIRQLQSAPGASDGPWFIIFDSILSEDVTLASTVTKHPVASGVSLSDHMYDEPAKVIVTAVVSNVLPWAALGQVQLGIDPPVDPYYDVSTSRSSKALARLEALRAAKEPFLYQSGLKLFESMVLEKIHYVTDKDTAEVLAVTLDLTEVKIVYTQAVIYPVRKDKPTKRKADAPTNKGKADATELETAKQKEELKAIGVDTVKEMKKLIGDLFKGGN